MTMVSEYSAVHLLPELKIDSDRWGRIPSAEMAYETARAVEKRGTKVLRVQSGRQAMDLIKGMIPAAAEVMTGSSTTLIEVGFQDYLSRGHHEWNDLHRAIVSEDDGRKRGELRRKAVTRITFFLWRTPVRRRSMGCRAP